MSDIRDLGDFSYQLLEAEAEKRRQRREIEVLMAVFLEQGGKIQVVTIKTAAPRPTKYLNRSQRKKDR